MPRIMALLSKYINIIFAMWFGTFAWSLIGDASILKTISLVVGIILGILASISKGLELYNKYQEKTVEKKIYEILEHEDVDIEVEESIDEVFDN